jgi:hypothetical protein
LGETVVTGARVRAMRNYVSRLHHLEVAALVLLTLAFSVVGWLQRPPSSGFSAVPSGMTLYVTKAPAALIFTETMAPSSDGGSVLAFKGSSGLVLDGPGPQLPTGRWTFVVNNLGSGRLCTPSRAVINGVRVQTGSEHPVAHPTLGFKTRGYHLTGITGTGAMYVQLCWPPGVGPVAENGAYLNARFPPLLVFAGQEGNGATRQLNESTADPADYTIQSLQQPTSVTSAGWQWSTNALGVAAEPLSFAAVNTGQTQHDTYDAFLSGIFFGVAGGALVALILALIAPFALRQKGRASDDPGG